MKKVFLDSSVLFTAVNSPSGGSSKLFTLKTIRLLTSPVVLAEVERNVSKKLVSYHLERFFLLVRQLTIVDQHPSDRLIAKAKKCIAQKDAIILAEAKTAPCDMLVTLDRKHFLTEQAKAFIHPKKILLPKDVITLYS